MQSFHACSRPPPPARSPAPRPPPPPGRKPPPAHGGGACGGVPFWGGLSSQGGRRARGALGRGPRRMPRGAGLGPGACRLREAWRRGGLEALAREPAARALGQKAWREVRGSPGGLAWLIDVRAKLLGAGSEFRAAHPDLEPSLRAELCGAFLPAAGTRNEAGSRQGGLAAKVLTQDSPAAVLQRAVDAERVHSMASTRELLPRLTDPFCGLALEHPELGGRPLAFLYTRLFPRRGDLGQTLARVMPSACSLQSPAAQFGDPAAARSAVFYSVSAAEPGLQGLGMAGLLIKRAVGALSASHPRLSSFATLSPVRGFRRWVLRHGGTVSARLRALVSAPDDFAANSAAETEREQLLADLEEHRAGLLGLCARYLLKAREDPVFRFHTRNGAVPWDLHWAASRSRLGLHESLGVMATYAYFPGPAPPWPGDGARVSTPMEALAVGSVRALRRGRPGPCAYI